MRALVKYPRTPHLEGSRLQVGDHDLQRIPFRDLEGRFVVVEEKVDGANAALRFNSAGEVFLQSRGHYLRGGAREKHFNLFKRWAKAKASAFWPVLRDRYVVYGEWLYAKHTVYYDKLPHFFLEFDVLDLETNQFLGTHARRRLLNGLPLASVPVLHHGKARSIQEITSLLGRSHYKGEDWREQLVNQVKSNRLNAEIAIRETDPSDDMEGLYIKVEEEDRVICRVKFVRASFLTCVADSGTHWLRRPIIPNCLAKGMDIWL